MQLKNLNTESGKKPVAFVFHHRNFAILVKMNNPKVGNNLAGLLQQAGQFKKSIIPFALK